MINFFALFVCTSSSDLSIDETHMQMCDSGVPSSQAWEPANVRSRTKIVGSAPGPWWNKKARKSSVEQCPKFLTQALWHCSWLSWYSFFQQVCRAVGSSWFSISSWCVIQRVTAMLGSRISEVTDSFIISTSGRLVVLDSSFSRPISAFEFISTHVTVMSESNCPPNIFLFCLDRTISCVFRMIGICRCILIRSLITVVIPMDLWWPHCGFLCSIMSSSTRKASKLNAPAGFRPMGMSCSWGAVSTSVVTWMSLKGPKRWSHWGGCSALGCRCVAKRRVCNSPAVEKKWITSPNWGRCWHESVIRRMVSPINCAWVLLGVAAVWWALLD